MPPGKPPSNLGCVLAVIALPFVILIGIVVGLVLRGGSDEATETSVTLDSGTLAGTEWQVDAVEDVDGQVCIFLYEDGADDPLNGSCDLQPQDVTYGDQTVVFGRADAGLTQVTVELNDGNTVDVDTTTANDLDGRFYVTVVDGDVNAEALAA